MGGGEYEIYFFFRGVGGEGVAIVGGFFDFISDGLEEFDGSGAWFIVEIS